MALEWQILIALVLDLLWGDPAWFPHPVKFVGRFALSLEGPLREMSHSATLAGLMAALVVIAGTGLAVWLLIGVAAAIHPFIGDLVSVLFLYWGIAARDMIRHATAVYTALRDGDLPLARERTAMICGRDTHTLDEPGITRAVVESVTENTIDGVVAPLFFAAMGGPVLMWMYKAVNTLDSCFGYKHAGYLEFGRASAKIDDAANFLPARIGGLLTAFAGVFIRGELSSSFRVFRRDRLKHSSPNSAHTEAAAAGAMGIQLGGPSYYHGRPSLKPTLGDPQFNAAPEHILVANALLGLTTILATAAFLAGRAAFLQWWGY